MMIKKAIDKNDNPNSVAHDVDVPTLTTDTGALDEEENYLNPIPCYSTYIKWWH